MRSNLIPTAVMDKNGKQTTVHKKADTGTTPKTSLPAPVPFPKQPTEVETYGSEVGGKLYELMEKLNGRQLGQDKAVFVMAATNQQRSLYLELLERNDGFWDIVSAATGAALKSRKAPGTLQMETIAHLYDKDLFTSIAAEPKARKARKQFLKMEGYMNAISYAYRDEAVRSVNNWQEALSFKDGDPEAFDEMRRYTKLMSAVREVDPEHRGALGDLAKFALHGGHDTDDVVSVIRQHHTTDTNVIDGILSGASPSIANGWL